VSPKWGFSLERPVNLSLNLADRDNYSIKLGPMRKSHVKTNERLVLLSGNYDMANLRVYLLENELKNIQILYGDQLNSKLPDGSSQPLHPYVCMVLES
jgi:hypothetical protein